MFYHIKRKIVRSGKDSHLVKEENIHCLELQKSFSSSTFYDKNKFIARFIFDEIICFVAFTINDKLSLSL